MCDGPKSTEAAPAPASDSPLTTHVLHGEVIGLCPGHPCEWLKEFEQCEQLKDTDLAHLTPDFVLAHRTAQLI